MTLKHTLPLYSTIIRAIFLLSFILLGACKVTNATENATTSSSDLPLFEPHVATFDCTFQKISPPDAQADAWFQQARKLESADIYIEDRDYHKIVELTRRAAERLHWNAMLNLASLYLEGRDPPNGVMGAIALVEKAMSLGSAAAYERMGTYYINGTGVVADATRAYAFWQQAARMGNPNALTFLGKKMQYKEDQPDAAGWANAKIGTKMLECAYAQGDGNAAFELNLIYSIPFDHDVTKEDLNRTLKVLHNGVKFGCQKCAARLSLQFNNPDGSARRIAPYVDKSRAERYRILSRTLGFNPERRFPNLDAILPLPPSDLPPWNGDSDTLINAALGINHPSSSPPMSSIYSDREGRFFLDREYLLEGTEETTTGSAAPISGFWQPITSNVLSSQGNHPLTGYPALYQIGERFHDSSPAPYGERTDKAGSLTWRLWRTARHDEGSISPPVVAGRARTVVPPEATTVCRVIERAPVTGTWQPWINSDHPMQPAVNQYWRQCWRVAGERFPDPLEDWMLDLPAEQITWHLMDAVGVDICPS